MWFFPLLSVRAGVSEKEENFVMCLFFLLKWHYYISLGHSLIFDYVCQSLDSDP